MTLNLIMKYFILTIGHMKNSPEGNLYEHFSKRIKNNLFLKEYVSKCPSGNSKKKDESKKLFEMIEKGGLKILLDQSGKQLSSKELSKNIVNWKNQGWSRINFIIGGANGVEDSLKNEMDFILSLSSMTWPHLLARSMLIEQIYRAETIISGHPYHRE